MGNKGSRFDRLGRSHMEQSLSFGKTDSYCSFSLLCSSPEAWTPHTADINIVRGHVFLDKNKGRLQRLLQLQSAAIFWEMVLQVGEDC